MIGGFFDRYHAGWDEAALTWFEDLLEEDEVDVLAWALGASEAPERFRGPHLDAMQRLDYVTI